MFIKFHCRDREVPDITVFLFYLGDLGDWVCLVGIVSGSSDLGVLMSWFG